MFVSSFPGGAVTLPKQCFAMWDLWLFMLSVAVCGAIFPTLPPTSHLLVTQLAAIVYSDLFVTGTGI